MAQQRKKGQVRFIRKRGRIIPIRSNKNTRAAGDIFSKKNLPALATIGAASGAAFGGLYAAGRAQKKSNSLLKVGKTAKANSLNRMAKVLKFKSRAVPAIIAGTALLSIDRRSRDEGTVFDIGNTKGAFNVATTLGLGYLAARTGKRFEKWGLRGGKFPWKLRDI
jgi:hypothetical protein